MSHGQYGLSRKVTNVISIGIVGCQKGMSNVKVNVPKDVPFGLDELKNKDFEANLSLW